MDCRWRCWNRASEEGCCPAGVRVGTVHREAASRSVQEELETGTDFCCHNEAPSLE